MYVYHKIATLTAMISLFPLLITDWMTVTSLHTMLDVHALCIPSPYFLLYLVAVLIELLISQFTRHFAIANVMDSKLTQLQYINVERSTSHILMFLITGPILKCEVWSCPSQEFRTL